MGTDAATDPVPTSHPVGFRFFFWGEFAERCSYYGMRAILALYMTEKLGVDKADAGTFMSLFIAACYFFPLVGGYVADNFLGKYWTIVLFSVPYVAAQFLVGIEDKYVVFGALVLLAMGSGVIKPNISTLMGMTYEQQRPGQEQLLTSAFSWFYMAINFGAGISQLAMPWLRTNYSYQVAFLFPAGLMALALMLFAAGKRYYAKETIERKVVTDGPPPEDTTTITGIPVRYKAVTQAEKDADRALKIQVLSRIGLVFLLVMFFWAIFDQSASTWIFFADTYMENILFGVPVTADQIQAFNAWFIVLLVPASVFLFKSLDQAGLKVKATQKMAVGFLFTGLAMAIMSLAGFMAGAKQDAVKITTPEGAVVVPVAKTPLKDVKAGTAEFGPVKVTAADWAYDEGKKRLTFASGTVRLADGKELLVTGGHLVAEEFPDAAGWERGGVLEPLLKSGEDRAKAGTEPTKATAEVIDWVKPAERVTVWWQVLAYLIITVAEILISVTGLELAFVAAPQSMKSFVTGCWLAVVFLANLLINAPITRLYPVMAPGVYFAMLAGAMVVVVVVFIPVAMAFNRGMAAQANTAPRRIGEAETEAV
ncbi:POT-type proton-dependent oligopeptide transporter [Urbifossiella limnaea]|uniref:Dipeptide and tripeptide permease A n=1 Tax=Urbifossiella limnaea TaxID=2528023 RepID=A0A517Y095_9BACT|nr:MFS transporter [Urbifossiella limnaea]QDU23169.1 Dipeptide and tripeptide permease A [Urbifossiella limnaea]